MKGKGVFKKKKKKTLTCDLSNNIEYNFHQREGVYSGNIKITISAMTNEQRNQIQISFRKVRVVKRLKNVQQERYHYCGVIISIYYLYNYLFDNDL